MGNTSDITLKDRADWLLHHLFRFLPIPVVSACGAFLGRWSMRGHIRRDSKWVARYRKNVAHLFGSKVQGLVNEQLIRLGENIGRNMAEYAVNDRFYKSRDLRYEGLENLQDLNRPPILITGHMGNFELAASCCVYQGRPVSTISDLSLNPIQRSIAVAVRSRCFARAPGSYMIEAGSATMRHVLKAMESGQILVFYCDEYKDNLVWGPSLGRDVPLRGNRVLAAKLAHKFQAPIVPVTIRRDGGCNLVSVTEPPIYRPESDGASVEEIANRIDQCLETWVRTNYDQWYWAPQLALERPFPQS